MKFTDFRVFLILLCLNALSLLAQGPPHREAYINRFKDVAIREMEKYGIPASITLAQGILESGDGRSKLAVQGNNHFGIKCHLDWDGGRIYHDDDEDDECFRKYKNAEDSYRDHSLFLTERSRYAFLFELRSDDYIGWAKGLKKAGYATNPKYADKLIKLIEDYNLHRFDHLSADLVVGEHAIRQHPAGVKYVLVQKGDSWESLSNELEMSVKRLLKYNERNYDSPLVEGDFVFLQKKRKRGKQEEYLVKEGDNMYSISQEFGIRLRYLYERNNMGAGQQPKAGDMLILR
jgi:LysM repeat protein